jgi:hypothetical protein
MEGDDGRGSVPSRSLCIYYGKQAVNPLGPLPVSFESRASAGRADGSRLFNSRMYELFLQPTT